MGRGVDMSDIYSIPINSNSPSYKMRTTLGNDEYVFKIDWNERLSRWMFSLYDAQDNPLVVGLYLRVNFDLLSRFKINGMPSGMLMLYDASGSGEECGRNELGTRCKLLFRSAV